MTRSARPPSARAESTGVFFDTDSGGRLHEYEMIVVMNPEIAEEDVPSAIERVTTAVTSRGGEVVEVQPWGRRKLAYPIGPHTEGNYVLTQIRLDPLREFSQCQWHVCSVKGVGRDCKGIPPGATHSRPRVM